MASGGIGKILEGIRREISALATQNRIRCGELQRQLDEQGARLDKIDKPKHSQTRPAKAKQRGRANNPPSDVGANQRLMPIPDRPEVMRDAEVGRDPR